MERRKKGQRGCRNEGRIIGKGSAKINKRKNERMKEQEEGG